MAVTGETQRLIRDSRRTTTTLTDDQTLDLVSAWVSAWSELKPEYEASVAELVALERDGVVPLSKVRANKRLRDALDITREQLEKLAGQANKTISAAVPEAVNLGGATTAAVLGSQLPAGASVMVGWDRVNPEALAAIVERSTQRIHAATLPISADVEAAMKRQLIRGIATGNNPSVTARRILNRAEGNFNGGLTRALTIAHTETLDALRAGAHQSAQDNTDILKGWRWSCDLSARTCPACLAKHGTMHDTSEPGPEGHQNCRCARIDVTKSWADLGFKNVTEPEDTFPDAEQWFDGLTEDTQRTIMGPERLRLLQSGETTWADLATLRHTDGWRDSWGVTPVAALKAS